MTKIECFFAFHIERYGIRKVRGKPWDSIKGYFAFHNLRTYQAHLCQHDSELFMSDIWVIGWAFLFEAMKYIVEKVDSEPLKNQG